MAEGKPDFYAEIGLKLNETQAKSEAKKGAKITADAIERSLRATQAKMRSSMFSVLPKKGTFNFSADVKDFLKEREIWKKIIEKNDAALEKELNQAFKVEEKKRKETLSIENKFKRLFFDKTAYEKASSNMSLEEKKKFIEEDFWEKKREKRAKANEKRVLSSLKEEEKARTRINKAEETNRKNKERAEKSAQKEKERLERAQKRKEEKQHNERVKRLKSLAKWTIGATAAGAYFAQRTINQSAERAFSFRNFSDVVGQEQYGNLRKFQAASKVFGNIGEKESASAFKQLFEFQQKMRLGLGQNTNASRLLGINWAETDTRKLINNLSNAILRQDKGLQGILTKEVFGDERFLSVFKRWQENPEMVWDVEKEVERNSLTEQQIKDLDELRQVIAKLSLQTTNLVDQFSAVVSTDLKKWIGEFSDSVQLSTKEIKSIWGGVKTAGKIIGAPVEAVYSAGKWAVDAMTTTLQHDLYNEAKWKAQDRFDAIMKQKEVSETNNNQKTINVNVGGVTVNKNEDTQKVIHDAVFGSVQGVGEINNVYLQMPTLTGG